MMAFNVLVLVLLLLFIYSLLFSPALLLWFGINKLLLQKKITKAKARKTVWLASLFLLVGLEFACLFYINAHPFFQYDAAVISEETAEKVLKYVHEHPERFKVDDFAGFDLSKITFRFREEIFIVNGNADQISYSVQALPIGEEHYPFFRVNENDELVYGGEIIE
jgi:hypothetical protein